MTGTLYRIIPSNNRLASINQIIAEGKAKNWIVKEYVPFEELSELLAEERDLTMEDVADHFNVPLNIVHIAIGIYRDRGLL